MKFNLCRQILIIQDYDGSSNELHKHHGTEGFQPLLS